MAVQKRKKKKKRDGNSLKGPETKKGALHPAMSGQHLFAFLGEKAKFQRDGIQ